jgi:hypothetical protein
MTSPELDNRVRIGKLKREPASDEEVVDLPNPSQQRTNFARPLSRLLGQWHLERDRDLVKIIQRLATSNHFPQARIVSMIAVDTPAPVT